jgi:hypothetical protein
VGLVFGLPWALAATANDVLTGGAVPPPPPPPPAASSASQQASHVSDAHDEAAAAAARAAAVARYDPYAVRGAGWRLASGHLGDDVARLLGASSPLGRALGFGQVRWCFPAGHAIDGAGRGLVALTIDDAPGDNPAEFARLLDVLRGSGARATFFVTTRLVTAATAPLLARAASEGHELANHAPEDRSYARCSAAAFDFALREAHQVG